MNAEEILEELNITDKVLSIFPYGSRVYGTADENSDSDYIIVMMSSMLKDGSFRSSSPKTNSDRSIQGVVYSRGGFMNAINSYDIAALECLSLGEEAVIKNIWKNFKVTNWNEKEMVKKVIQKASASRHVADQQAKGGNKDRAKKGMFHALRILYFGLQLKEHRKIVDFGACNDMYYEFKNMHVDDFDTRDYYREFDELLVKLRA